MSGHDFATRRHQIRKTRASSTPASIANHLVLGLLLLLQDVDLILKESGVFHGFLHRGSEFVSVPGPALVVSHELVVTTLLPLDLLTKGAFLGELKSLKDHLHAARFTTAVLLLAVLTEVAPLPVTADELGVVVVTHPDSGGLFEVSAYLRQSLETVALTEINVAAVLVRCG